MPVWAFACKNESSCNRWFDGTKQDVHLSEIHNFSFGSKKLDFLNIAEAQRKAWLKNISPFRSGLGVKVLNTYALNSFARRIGDHSDSVFMQDDVEINFSREMIHVNDSISLMDGIERQLEKDNNEFVVPIDTFTAWLNDSDGTLSEEASLGDKVIREFVRTIAPDTKDDITFSEKFSAKIGGRSIQEYIRVREQFTKQFENEVGDESRANPLNNAMLNKYMLNSQSDTVVNVNLIGLTEEVQIILT